MCESYNILPEFCNTSQILLTHLCTVNINFILQKKNMINTNELKLKGNRKEIKGKLKQKISLLTGDDLMLLDGEKDELIGRFQFKSGKTKKEIRKLISGL